MTAQKVATIAKKVVMKSAETKSFLGNSGTIAPLDTIYNVQNLIFPIAQGLSAENIIGEKLHILNMRIRLNMFTTNNSNNITKYARVVCFAIKKPLTNTNTTITASEIFRVPLGANPTQHHVDLHKVDLLYDNVFTLVPQVAAQTVQRFVQIPININKSVTFESDNSGYLKNKNYYLAVMGQDGSSISSPVTFTYTYSVNFKDE